MAEIINDYGKDYILVKPGGCKECCFINDSKTCNRINNKHHCQLLTCWKRPTPIIVIYKDK